jgi:PAS domain S-box-containing protein
MREDIRVLHVDDDPDVCEMTALQLESLNPSFSVTTLTDPELVLDRVAEAPVDCLVSDFEMPGMNGLELLEAVRADHPGLPFILLTGKGSEEIASRAIGAGVTAYLQKKVGTEQYERLANRIESAVDRNRSKGALADSQRRLELLVDQSPLAVVEWDEALRVVRWNAAAAEMFGYTAEAALGRHVSVLFPDDSECADEIGTRLLESGGRHSDEFRTTTRDGAELVCEWHNLTVTDDEDALSVFSLVQDVSERHERETERQRYETMVETVADGVYTLGEDLRFTTVNEGMVSLTGYDRDRLVGSHLSLLLSDADVAAVRRGREATRQSDSDTNSIDLTVRTADGTEIPCAVRYRVRREDGAFAGTAGVFRPQS